MKRILSIVVLALSLCISLAAQTRVSGVVLSAEDGSPVSGAFVTVTGNQSVYATTDANGKFVLNSVPAGAKTLDISVLGMEPKTATIAPDMIVELQADKELLDEVMVVAYGTAKKGTYTGAATMIKQEKIKDVPTASFQNALMGKVAGLQINNTTGQVGSFGQVRVRGTGSINASNEPLYVIDGVPVINENVTQLSCVSNDVMSTLNPSDIESITVLKDAAASSLYGSRAANGVIVIQTKRGKSGKPVITFKANLGISPAWATENWTPASYTEQKELMYEMRYNQYLKNGKTAEYAATEAQKIVDNTLTALEDPRGEFNWEKALFRNAVYQNYDINVSGATDKTSYYTSVSYSDEEGRSMNNDFSRLSGRANITQKIGKIFEASTNMAVTYSEKSGFNDTDNGTLNYFQMSRNRLFPCYYPYDEDGKLKKIRWNNTPYNILWYDDYWSNSSKTLKVSAIESLQANIIPEILSAKTTFSYDNYNIRDYSWYGPTHFYRSSKGGQVDSYVTNKTTLVSSSTLNYTQMFGDHSISALVGFEAESNHTDYTRATGTNLPNDIVRTVAAAGTLDANAYTWGNTMVSVLSKAEYSYASRYFLSGSFRRDGSSKLGPSTRWGNFWSVSGSWKISNEEFMKNVSWVNDLRLRASYGTNGTLPSSNYAWIPTYSYDNTYKGSAGGYIDGTANENLTWETSYTWNLAVESALFNNRLHATAEFFTRDSKGLILPVQTSRVTGFTTVLQNVGQIRNRGVELSLDGDIIRTHDWTWNLGATVSMVKGTVMKLYNGEDIIWYDPTGGDDNSKFIYREGESTYAFYGNEWAGVESATGKAMWYINPKDGEKYTADAEVNGRPVTYSRNKSNEVIMGCAEPKAYGGINSSLSWKNLSLDLGFTYSLGGQTYDALEVYCADDGLYRVYMQTKYYYDNRWTPEHTDAVYPIRVYDAVTAKGYQSRKLHPGDYLRLKNASLSYTLPKGALSKANISNMRVFATGTNVFTWSAFGLYDPERNIYGTTSWAIPQCKTYTVGVELTF